MIVMIMITMMICLGSTNFGVDTDDDNYALLGFKETLALLLMITIRSSLCNLRIDTNDAVDPSCFRSCDDV